MNRRDQNNAVYKRFRQNTSLLEEDFNPYWPKAQVKRSLTDKTYTNGKLDPEQLVLMFADPPCDTSIRRTFSDLGKAIRRKLVLHESATE